MSENLIKNVKIRPAKPEDVVGILEMVAELAEFEKLSDQLVATEADYQNSLFGLVPVAEALVAENSKGLIGYAIFFSTFSTFIGRAGIWLEDLYVKEAFRHQGVGKRLLKSLGKIAQERDAGRYEWCVLDWNQNAIDLYEQVGGEILEEWRIVRMDRKGIENLPEK
ncbi:GNAT family N-acetyltransferase [Verrucomicrobiales bacterium]|nr:GNAT family N-acetyltransferase [Verrucomicrobiales bacterium]MDB4358799.1 GNAT family N-acetyltransferase [Verrucomicrobiales bacterium]